MNNESVIGKHLRWLLRGTLTLLLLSAGWWTLGRWAGSRDMGFLRIAVTSAEASSVSDAKGTVIITRSHACIQFADSIRQLRSGDSVTRTFVLSSNQSSRTPHLGFFVSGNQRARPLPLLKPDFVLWQDMPLEYSVKVNSKTVATGRVAELSRAFFVEIPVESSASMRGNGVTDIQVELTLRCLEDCQIPSIPPALAIEYPFYITADDAQSGAGPDTDVSAEVRTYRHAGPVGVQDAGQSAQNDHMSSDKELPGETE